LNEQIKKENTNSEGQEKTGIAAKEVMAGNSDCH